MIFCRVREHEFSLEFTIILRNVENCWKNFTKYKNVKIFLEVIVSYVTVLEDWNIAPDNLILLNKKLGEGQFGIVRQELLTTGKCDSEIVAVKTLKGTKL